MSAPLRLIAPALLLMLASFSTVAEGSEPVLKVGDVAPPFRLFLYNADKAGMASFNLRDYVGDEAQGNTKAVLVSFFASWCHPCKRELPTLVKLYEKYRSKGVQMISISIDGDDAGFKKIETLIAADHVVHPVGKDRFQIVARKYLGAQATLPAVFIIKRDGTIAFAKQRYDTDVSALLDGELKKLTGG